MRLVVYVLASLILSVFLLCLTELGLDGAGIVTGWSFWHGGFAVAWPVCLFLAFAALLCLPWFRRSVRACLVAAAAILTLVALLYGAWFWRMHGLVQSAISEGAHPSADSPPFKAEPAE